jgi:DNA-binding MarR family transcriptional regulator
MGRRSLFGERKFKPLDRPLTAKQDDILHFLWAFYMQNDQLPPVNQICDEFLIYPQAGTDHLKALARKGYIRTPAPANSSSRRRLGRTSPPLLFRSIRWTRMGFSFALPSLSTLLN